MRIKGMQRTPAHLSRCARAGVAYELVSVLMIAFTCGFVTALRRIRVHRNSTSEIHVITIYVTTVAPVSYSRAKTVRNHPQTRYAMLTNKTE